MPFRSRRTDNRIPADEIKYELGILTGIGAFDSSVDTLFRELNDIGIHCTRSGIFSRGAYEYVCFIKDLPMNDRDLFLQFLDGEDIYYATS